MLMIYFQVTLVRWNEPYQKLASCDTSGIIFVWIKYEGRWSIELINDRNTPVICFAWSHDGRMALICYQVNKAHQHDSLFISMPYFLKKHSKFDNYRL